MKVRQNLYLDRELSDALEALATGPGANKSRLVNDAIAAWLARRGTQEVDDLFKHRLDRMSREIASVNKISETEAVRQIELNLAKSPRRGPKGAEAAPAEEAA